jgi:cytochrome c peroxidase
MRNTRDIVHRVFIAVPVVTLLGIGVAYAADAQPSSYAPVVAKEPFDEVMSKMKAAKPEIMKRHMDLLAERYDLSDRPAKDVTMSRGKPVQEGVRVKLLAGTTWEALAKMKPEEIQAKDLFPRGFLPLPHPNHPEGGMLFPQHHIDEIKKQEARDLTRFDLDYDLPAHFLPEFPPPIYLTTRPDLGDVSKGKLVTIENYYELFSGIMNPKQLEGLRLLVTPFPQQQFNQSKDRRSENPAGASSASIATSTVTPMPPRIWWGTYARRSFAIAWTRRHSAA